MPGLNSLHAAVIAIAVFFMSMTGGFAQVETGADDATAAQSSSVAELLDLLKDDDARAQLIADLEKAVASTQEDASEADTDLGTPTLGARVADLSKTTLETASAKASELFATAANSRSVLDGLSGYEVSVLWSAAEQLLLIIIATISVYIALRRFAVRFFRSFNMRLATASWRLRSSCSF